MHIPVFTHATRKAIGRWALYLAIFSFIVHLLLHLFRSYIPGGMEAALLKDPISAIYTPFSILLVYEAYLMIYYLRRSTTIYIAKQYEVISLILIRGLFKDMAALDLKIATWSSQHNLEFAARFMKVVGLIKRNVRPLILAIAVRLIVLLYPYTTHPPICLIEE